MEIVVYTPNLYLSIQDAIVFIQLCLNDIIHIASQIKI
jgi:hypothetical protein